MRSDDSGQQDLNMSQQCALAARRATHNLVQHCYLVEGRDGLALLCARAASPQVCVPVWALQYKKDIKLSESVQRRATKW